MKECFRIATKIKSEAARRDATIFYDGTAIQPQQFVITDDCITVTDGICRWVVVSTEIGYDILLDQTIPQIRAIFKNDFKLYIEVKF